MTSTYIAGAGMVRFGKYPADTTFEKLAIGAARAAMADAGVSTGDIESVYVGHVFGGPVAGQRVCRPDGARWVAGIQPRKLLRQWRNRHP